MPRLPLLLLALSLLGGCTVYGHGDHDYHRPYYYGGYQDHRHSSYPTRYYYYDRHDSRRYAPSVRYYDRHARDYDRRYDGRHDRGDYRYDRHDRHDRRFDGDRRHPTRSYSRAPEPRPQGKPTHRAGLYKAQPQGRWREHQRDGRREH